MNLRNLRAAHRVMRRHFHAPVRSVAMFAGWLALRSFVAVTSALDDVFYPTWRDVRIDRPLFIVGNPRSGTTFLHRFLARSGAVASFELWQMMVPSLVGQRLLRPLVPFLGRFNPARHHGAVAHESGLDALETDDVLLFFRFLDGLFLYAYLLAWDEDPHDAVIAAYDRGAATNQRDLAFHRRCAQRNLLARGKPRVLGKPFTFALRIEDVLAQYPDARLVYLVRDPTSVIPSGLNLLGTVLDAQYGVGGLAPEIRNRWFQRLYQGEVLLYRRFHDALQSGRIPPENVLVLRYDDLMADLEGTITRIAAFADLDLDPAFREEVADMARRQRAYESRHRYDLAAFGLTEARIHADLDFVYRTFDLPRGGADPSRG